MYKFVSKNCADFVKDAVNFYYPKAIHRGVISELGVSTPKHASKTMVQYAKKHPELHLTAFIIPQVPGTIRRSRPVRGVVESVFKAKKYEVTLLALHPVVGGAFAAAYLFGGGPFNPGKNALMLSPDGDLQAPLSAQDRRWYQKGLEEITKANAESDPRTEEATWHHLLDGAQLSLDAKGQPILVVRSGDELVEVGITRDNVLNSAAPRHVMQDLLVARMREQLRSGRVPKTSEAEVRRDWDLVKAAFVVDNRDEIAGQRNAGSAGLPGGGIEPDYPSFRIAFTPATVVVAFLLEIPHLFELQLREVAMKRRLLSVLSAVCALSATVGGIAPAVDAGDKHPFNIDDYSALRRAEAVAMSPDGKSVLYKVSWAGTTGPVNKHEWHIVELSGANGRVIELPENFEASGFTKEGTAVFGLMPVSELQQLAIVPLATGTATQIVALPSGTRGVKISPDGARFAVLADPRKKGDPSFSRGSHRGGERRNQSLHRWSKRVGRRLVVP